ncbi:RNA polymerase-associated protein RapA [Aggregatibacter kilianii]|uniref:RNA polymerase-associated protein RapA n=1 Tax=Aggregatibacter kilianii TaxID=2025884 RepID=UPI000D649479|nr:RNA polymerase-associated protein RapA [Aggregatibacter kilianii]
MTFAVGQRWISETENHLGLGRIAAIENRQLVIDFPAAQEQRIYALQNAPLSRVQFRIGDQIQHVEGWRGEVINIMENNGLLFYLVRQPNQQETVVAEMALAHQISFSRPQERLFSAQIDRSEHFALRYQALQYQKAQFQSPLRGLRGIRAGLIPHQLHIANEAGQRIAPRVLLADEVGLGKTIEAGMILQQQLFAEKVRRVLIIVPETLQHQWLVEMLRRFNLPFSLFDEERCADFAATDEREEVNPFTIESLIICALDWLVQTPKRVQQILSADFDMLIADEVHHLVYDEVKPSTEYQLVQQLTQQIPAVLLLTATPEQLGQQSHFARLNLLDAHRFHDYQAFLQEQQNYQPIAEAAQALLANRALSAVEKNSISALLGEPIDFENVNKAALIKQLIDRHGTGRLLFRNTRQSVQGFPKRVYHPIALPLPTQYANLVKSFTAFGGDPLQIALYPEHFMTELNPEAAWWDADPRVSWLMDFIAQHRREKVLVICRYANTAIRLEQILREKQGVRSAVFHEKMSIVERDRAAAYFTQQEGGAQVLLSSSIGSEGRNFQFANHLVLFNLPENPDLLEQCIGRLDRIGQTRDIQIYQPYFADSAQAVLADWYHLGLNAFNETCPMGALLFEQFDEELQKTLENPTALEARQNVIERTRAERLRLKQLLEQGRDVLLELNSNGGEQAKQLAQAIAAQDGSPELVNFALNLFDVIGVEQEDLGEQSIVITPTGTMLMPDFPGLKEEGVTVTFDRQLALAREELEFLTWDHPMIYHGIDLIVSGDIGKTAVALLVNKNLPAGTLLLELIYVVESQAPQGLQLTRFLPPTPIRLLLDNRGNDLAAQVAFDTLQRKLKPIDRNVANNVVKMLRPNIEALIAQGERLVVAQSEHIIADAQQQATQQLDAELNRLIALQKVNKNIRAEEILTLENQRTQILQLLQQATWRLDCLRVIVTNKE